jgi:hypothetical protein
LNICETAAGSLFVAAAKEDMRCMYRFGYQWLMGLKECIYKRRFMQIALYELSIGVLQQAAKSFKLWFYRSLYLSRPV